jgi:hypothetical protein
MRKRQKLFELPQHELIQDVVTRWNSTQLMMERLCEQRHVVSDIMLDPSLTKKDDMYMLIKENEWETMAKIGFDPYYNWNVICICKLGVSLSDHKLLDTQLK